MTIEFDPMEFEPSADRSGERTRHRVIVGVVAAMLIALAGGLGFGLGRSVDDSPDQATLSPAAEGDGTSSDEDQPPATEAPIATLAPPTTTTAPNPEVTSDAPVVTTDASYASDTALAEADLAGSGGPGYGYFGTTASELIFERTTETGLTLRAHLGELWPNDAFGYGADGWTPPSGCFQSGELRIAIAGNGIIDVGSVGWYEEPFNGQAVSWVPLGSSDGQPMWVVVVQAPPGTTEVTVIFEDGGQDTAVPQDGVAVLAVPNTNPPTEQYVVQTPVFDVTFTGGADPASLGSDELNNWDNPGFAAACSPPPPALPNPGEQPADPATAEAEVVALMNGLYGEDREPGSGSTFLEDDTGVAEAREQVAEGGFSGEADTAKAVVEELVFTDPDETWFRYRVETSGTGLSDRYGIAVLIDGTWLITRNTVCQDLSMAGGDCGGGWYTNVPPSARLDE